MKATLTQEAPIYTIEVNGQKLTGMRQDGTLGPVRRLKNDKGEQVFVLHNEGFASLMRSALGLPDQPDGITVIAASPSLASHFDQINDEPLLQMALDALVHHTGQTRPIESTTAAIAALRARLGKTSPEIRP